MTICAFICGADSWTDVEDFGHAKAGGFKMFLALPNGIPSHDTLGRVFARLDPEAFRQCFVDWMDAVAEVTQGEVVAIDGKTLCRSYDRAGINPPFTWSAPGRRTTGSCWANTRPRSKSNEITAIPALLKLLALDGCVVTIDAMGCQKAIAGAIRAGNADYVLALKGNRGSCSRYSASTSSSISLPAGAPWSDI